MPGSKIEQRRSRQAFSSTRPSRSSRPSWRRRSPPSPAARNGSAASELGDPLAPRVAPGCRRLARWPAWLLRPLPDNRPTTEDRERARRLADPKDVPILAAAIGAGSRLLVTHNVRHVRSGEGVRVVRPRSSGRRARGWRLAGNRCDRPRPWFMTSWRTGPATGATPQRVPPACSTPSALQPAHHDGADDPLLAEDEDGENGQDAEHGGGRHQVVLDEVHVGEADQAERDHLPGGAVDAHQRPEQPVPRPHELDDDQSGQGRPHRGQDHPPEDPELAGAVDAGGVDVFARHDLDRLPHEEDAEHAHEIGSEDPQVGVEEPESAHPQIQGNDHRLEGHHEDPDDGEEEQIARSEEHTSELQSLAYLVCRLLLEKKKKYTPAIVTSDSI